MCTLERETYLVLSTAHLKAETAERISDLPIVSDETDARIRVPLLDPPLQIAAAIPDDLANVIAWTRDAAPDVYGIIFDRDGPILEQLPSYHW